MRNVTKISVLGSGVMGSRIACHFANAGFEVLLLDIAPKALNDSETKKGLSLDNPIVKNRIVNDSLNQALKSSPSPIYSKSFISRITTGNFDDNLQDIKHSEWVIEAIIEDLDIKKSLYAKIEKIVDEHTLISTNSSGLPINKLIEGRNETFCKNFCGTHFFNPPRYLSLLEIIPSEKTSTNIVEFLMTFGEKILGKKTVLCKDTPAFIANRIGVFAIMSIFHAIKKYDMSIETVDALTGTMIDRPKSATFRTCDVVGLDTLVFVAKDLKKNCPDDEQNAIFEIPDFIQRMFDEKKLGSKTNEGFYKKIDKTIHALNLKTWNYEPVKKEKLPIKEAIKQTKSATEKLKVLISDKTEIGAFYRHLFFNLFSYVSFRIPEISSNVKNIDDAIEAGFGWEYGPFKIWDMLGIKECTEMMKEANISYSAWIDEMLSNDQNHFYKPKESKYYEAESKHFIVDKQKENVYSLEILKQTKLLWNNSACSITDMGDKVIHLQFATKMNSIGSEVLEGVKYAIEMAEKDYRGLVISNQGNNFSAGANVGMIFMLAAEQETDELLFASKTFQDVVMQVRYSSIPVVVAPHNLALGGACEICLHADKVIAHAELYMGLVEVGVGIIPAGAGTKEFALRASDDYQISNTKIDVFRNRFMTIAQAKVSTSAYEAFELGYLRKGIDEIIMNKNTQVNYAKQSVLQMYDKGYTKPIKRKDIWVLGEEALGIVDVGAEVMQAGNYISDHDLKISKELGYVMAGGDLSAPTLVDEDYLLKLEREAFVKLALEQKTLERLQHVIQKGKVLRN